MKRPFISLPLALFVTTLAICESSAAQPIAGRFQLGVASSLFSYTSRSTENDDTTVEADTSSARWGVRDQIALDVGYGLSDAIVVGGVLVLGGTSTTVEPEGRADIDSSEFEVKIGPKIDLMFGPDSLASSIRVKPFVGAVLSLVSASEESEGFDTTLTGFELLGRVGLRLFPTESFSVETALVLGWSTASGEIEPAGAADQDISSSAFVIALMIGLAGWI